jgi:hypothetical protein
MWVLRELPDAAIRASSRDRGAVNQSLGHGSARRRAQVAALAVVGLLGYKARVRLIRSVDEWVEGEIVELQDFLWRE